MRKTVYSWLALRASYALFADVRAVIISQKLSTMPIVTMEHRIEVGTAILSPHSDIPQDQDLPWISSGKRGCGSAFYRSCDILIIRYSGILATRNDRVECRNKFRRKFNWLERETERCHWVLLPGIFGENYTDFWPIFGTVNHSLNDFAVVTVKLQK